MMDASFLRAFGKVLYTVTVAEGAMMEEEVELLAEEVSGKLGSFMDSKLRAAIKVEALGFDPAEVEKASRNELGEALLREVIAQSRYQDPGLREASIGLLRRMATTFGNMSADTTGFIDHLEGRWPPPKTGGG